MEETCTLTRARSYAIGDMNRGRWEFDTVANMLTSGVPLWRDHSVDIG